jgi:dGTPase
MGTEFPRRRRPSAVGLDNEFDANVDYDPDTERGLEEETAETADDVRKDIEEEEFADGLDDEARADLDRYRKQETEAAEDRTQPEDDGANGAGDQQASGQESDSQQNADQGPSDRGAEAEYQSGDQRSAFERDRDRILYSREFRRLKDVTQVARVGETYLHHDRLTHSLKVSQVGCRLAQRLVEVYEDDDRFDIRSHLNRDAVEAACLAHDIGHPPFGHEAEQVLDERVRHYTGPDEEDEESSDGEDGTTDTNAEADTAANDDRPPVWGFEGNAQSFRIMARLASHRRTDAGLDLTRATLNALLKYPWERDAEGVGTEKDTDEKWGFYPTESAFFEFARAGMGADKRHRQTLEAQIMDYADDITYAIHDMDDFYRDGFLPLDQLLRETAQLLPDDPDELDPTNVEEIIKDADAPSEHTELKKFASYIERESDTGATEKTVLRLFVELLTSQVMSGRLERDDLNPEYSAEVSPRTNYEILSTPYEGTSREQDALNSLTSFMVEFFTEALEATPSERNEINVEPRSDGEGLELEVTDKFERYVSVLTNLTVYYVITDSTLMAQQHGHQEIIRRLFDELYDEITPDEDEEGGDGESDTEGTPESGDDGTGKRADGSGEPGAVESESSGTDGPGQELLRTVVPTGFQERVRRTGASDDPRCARLVADIIARMTEQQAIQMYERLTGATPGSLQNQIIR